MGKISFRQCVEVLALALAYFFSAELGLTLDAVGGVATPVWLPSGISLAAVLLLGYRVWPGIALGAFFANFAAGQNAAVSVGIAIGNTLEPMVGAFLLQMTGFQASLQRLRDVLLLLFFAGVCSTVISATIGVWSAWLGGGIPAVALTSAWCTWWSGDLLSDLIIAPFILTWSRLPSKSELSRRGPEFLCLILAATVACQMAFGAWSMWGRTPYPLVYLIFPFAIWAALRFNPRAASLVVLWVMVLAVWYTTRGIGPFRFATVHESLVALQFFIGILAITSLILSALFMERRHAEEDARRHISDLQRLSQLKSEFASIVAHELRTPLTVIKEGIGMVIDGVDGEINERQAETLNLAKDNVDRLGRLIKNVLDYEKLEAGKLDLELGMVDFNVLVREVFDFMELVAKKKNIRMIMDLPDAATSSLADADKIREVLINLVDNSLKNTSSGGKIHVRLMALSQKIILEVEDTGRGIPKEEQSHIFLMFRQVPAQGKVQIPGAGIGLAVCKLIVELHQGSISLKSEPGLGTKFKVELPIRRAGDRSNRDLNA